MKYIVTYLIRRVETHCRKWKFSDFFNPIYAQRPQYSTFDGPFLEVYSFAHNTIFCMYSNMAFLEVYSFGREIMQNRQYFIVSGIAFWKCTPLLRTPYFCIYLNMAFLEEKSCKIVHTVLSKMKCTPQELSVLLIPGDAYFLQYLIEK